MSKLFNEKIILLFIIFLASFLRFWQLGINPPSLTWDEAAWGYNAYCLGIDGKDEFGRFLPLTYIESFGDFKPPLYAYLSVIPIKIFGLTEFSTRFTSAFFGILTVLLTYFLVKKFFEKTKYNNLIAIISTFVMAISPWHIMLSRAAFEANVATFFIVLGVYLFLLSLNNKKMLFPLSVLSFVLSMYTFNSARIVAPLLFLALIISKRKTIALSMKKEAMIGFVTGFVVFLPLALFLITPQARLRYQEVNIFSDAKIIERVNKEIENSHNTLFAKIVNNRRIAYGREFIKHYFDNLSPDFLFIKGDGNPKFSIQDVGQMYIWEIPFFVLGFLLLFKHRGDNWWIIPYWLFISIIPAATARETPHALRIESGLPTYQIISAFGIFYFIYYVKNNIKRSYLFKLICVMLVFIIFFNLVYFFHNYFTHYPKTFSREWQYGYKETIQYIKEVEANYDRIYFTDALGRPYIYILFYEKYDPLEFRKEAIIKREALGFVHIESFGKYIFYDPKIKNNNTILYIDTPGAVPSGAKVVKDFYLLNGGKVLEAYVF